MIVVAMVVGSVIVMGVRGMYVGAVAMGAIIMLDGVARWIARMRPRIAINPAIIAPISGRKTIDWIIRKPFFA